MHAKFKRNRDDGRSVGCIKGRGPPPSPATVREAGWAQKENRRNVGKDPRIEDKLRAMQREGTKSNRVTAVTAALRDAMEGNTA